MSASSSGGTGTRWIVRNSHKKATFLRRVPNQDHSSPNVIRMLRNGEAVFGDFLRVQRASRESGFILARHLQEQCGAEYKVCNADRAPTTSVRRQPKEVVGEANTVCYAAEGELVSGEFLFVHHAEDPKQGGFVKLRHLRRAKSASAEQQSSSGGGDKQQRWAVLDTSHDGAWLRKAPRSGRGEDNVVGLAKNGTVVAGDFMQVSFNAAGDTGYVRCSDLEQLSPKAWRVKPSVEQVHARSNPVATDPPMRRVLAGEEVEGEFVHVVAGEKSGFLKRRYLVPVNSRRQLQTIEEELAVLKDKRKTMPGGAKRPRGDPPEERGNDLFAGLVPGSLNILS